MRSSEIIAIVAMVDGFSCSASLLVPSNNHLLGVISFAACGLICALISVAWTIREIGEKLNAERANKN